MGRQDITVIICREGYGFASDSHSCLRESRYLDLVRRPAFQTLQCEPVHIWIYSNICNQSDSFSERWWQSALTCSSGEVVFQGPPGPILTFLHPGLRPVHGIEDYVTQQEAPGLFFWDGGPPQGRGVQRRVVAADVCRSTNGG